MNVYRSQKMQQLIHRTYDALLTQWGVPVQEMDVDTLYGSTHIVTCGNAANPPLVLFHGVGDDSALMWIYNAAHLSRFYRLYAVDTLGGPGKSVPGDKYNKDFDAVKWLDMVLDALGIQEAYFAGVSNGGYLVKLYAACRPERMIRGIGISSAMSTGDKKDAMKAMMKIFLPEALFPTTKNVHKLIRKMSGEHHAVFTENSDVMAHYAALLRGFNNMAMGYHKVRAFTPEETARILEKVTFLLGKEDPFVKLGGGQHHVDPRMKAFFFDGAGHGLNHELAEEINAKMVEILSAP